MRSPILRGAPSYRWVRRGSAPARCRGRKRPNTRDAFPATEFSSRADCKAFVVGMSSNDTQENITLKRSRLGDAF
jgi:hypothetical protein